MGFGGGFLKMCRFGSQWKRKRERKVNVICFEFNLAILIEAVFLLLIRILLINQSSWDFIVGRLQNFQNFHF